MLNIFIDSSEEVEVTISIGTVDGNIIADVSEEKLKEVYQGVTNIENHSIWFKVPDFGDQQKINDNSIKQSNGELQINMFAYRLNMMAILLKRWTFKDKDKDVPANRSILESIHPLVANVIGMGLELKLKSIGI